MPDFLDVCLEAAHGPAASPARLAGPLPAPRKRAERPGHRGRRRRSGSDSGDFLKAFPDHDFLGEEEAADRKAAGLPPIPPRAIGISLDRRSARRHDELRPSPARLCRFDRPAARRANWSAASFYDPLAKSASSASRGQRSHAEWPADRIQRLPASRSGPGRRQLFAECDPRLDRNHAIRRGPARLPAVRRLGSAALNLCYVAAGRLDAYLATSVQFGMSRPGCLIVEEAGGIVTRHRRRALDLERPELSPPPAGRCRARSCSCSGGEAASPRTQRASVADCPQRLA